MFKLLVDRLPFSFNPKLATTILLDVLAKGIPYLLLPVFLRLMTQHEFGLYTYIIFIIVSASTIFKLGMDTATTKFFYQYSTTERGRFLFTINTIVYGLLTVIMVAFAIFSANKPLLSKLLSGVEVSTEMVMVFWLNLFLYLTVLFLNVYYVIAEKFSLYQKYNLLRLLFVNLSVCFTLYFFRGYSVTNRLWVEAGGGLLILSPLIYDYCRQFQLQFDRRMFGEAFRVAFPVLLTNIVAITAGLADKYLLQDKKSIDDLAIYNLAIFLALPVSLLFNSFHSLWLPKVFQQRDVAIRYQNANAVLSKLFFLFIGVVLITWTGIIIALQIHLVPAEYESVRFIFPIVGLAFVLECLTQLYMNIVVSIGKTEYNLFINILVMLAVILLNIWLIPIFGIVATSFIYLFINALRLVSLRQLLAWKLVTNKKITN
jgi:O-antigen/teichoic acid export membrane protein